MRQIDAAIGMVQRRLSSRARAVAGCSPRISVRSGSGGTGQSAVASGRATARATRSAATKPRPRSPRSFQLRTSARAASSYAIAARADANASLRPAHSPQRRTGHAVGAPQRSQSGSGIRRRPVWQVAQSASPGLRQTTQRRGNSRSSTPATVRHETQRVCVSAVKRRGRLPRAARGPRCRTTGRAPAMCRCPRAGRATGRAGPAGRGSNRRRGTRG